MKKIAIVALLLLSQLNTWAQDKPKVLKVGDTIDNISLMNVDDKRVSLNDYQHVKGFIVVFMANTCDYCILYKDRIMALNQKYKSKGFPLITISPFGDSVEKYPLDAMPEMKKLAAEKKFNFPYLADEDFKYTHGFGLTYTPEVVLLVKQGSGYKIAYIGRIDDDPMGKKKTPKRILDEEMTKVLQ